MHKSSHNPRNYIKNKQNYQDYECGICFDLSPDLVKCKGPCQKVFCIQCVSQTKNVSDRCPNRCSKPFFATKLPPIQFEFHCPYSPTCPVPIQSVEQFNQHYKSCPFTPCQERAKNRLKEQYRCSKQHNLEFFIGKYNEMISSICAECLEPKLCRSICRKCDEKYCIQCRMPPCTKKTCPIGHEFTLFKDINLQYICDVCGMNASIFNTGIYDDKSCNFGICENCMEKLPETRDNKHLTRLINNQEKCQCGNNLVYAPETKSNCSLCERWKNCPKYCPSCDLKFCLKCKNLSIYEDFCEYQHQFQSILAEDYPGQGCMRCDKAAAVYVQDSQCGVTLCTDCKDYFHSVTSDRLRIRPVFCDEGHKLFYMKPTERSCKTCKQIKNVGLLCLQCETKQVHYCFQCKSIPFETCYFDHPFRTNNSPTAPLIPCSVCSQEKPEFKSCRKCKFYVCQSCHSNSIPNASPSLSQSLQQLSIS